MKKLGLIALLLLCSPLAFSQEICDDGIDNDADGLIDLLDTADCNCDGFGLAMSPVSLINNPSFEDYTCCPTSTSMMACADGWIMASGATSDYLHTCMGFTSLIPFNDPALPPPGGGDGYAGFHNSLGTGYKEYIGAHLTGPMLAGVCYTLDMWVAHSAGITDIEISIFGTPTAGDLPWGGFACPVGTGDWELLDGELISVAPSPGGAWTNVTLSFTPTVDILAVAIGPDCASTPPGYNYFFVDELILAECSAFSGGSIIETGNWCDSDLMLEADLDTVGGTWQWYKDSIAIVGETSATLDLMPHGPGVYTAIYTIGGGSDCEGMTYTVTIPDAPIADFTFGNVCDGDLATFTDASTPPAGGSITDWAWDFGDGGTSILEDPTHTYTSPGIYTVTLTVTSDLGCTHTITQDIEVYELPNADFDVPDICFGQNSMFDDISTGPVAITTWDWDFDDGGTSVAEDPSHLYATPGAYTVTLTVTDANGCSATTTGPHNITAMPVADFTFADICIYDDASFTDGSSVVGGTLSDWVWDFGDGGTSTDTDPTHTYTSPGTYTVELIAMAGSVVCSDTMTQTITVSPEPTADFTTGNVCDGEIASFTDASTVAAPDVIAGWAWDFGDAATSAVASPTHGYATPGTYNVTLTVTSDNGCVNTVAYPITVFEMPIPDFNSTSVCENGAPTTFMDLSTAPGSSISGWAWDFGDGGTSSVPGPTHKYDEDGTYMATLTVTSPEGCSNSVTYSVQVWEKPTPNFTASETVVCDPDCINFLDLSTVSSGSIVDWKWDFDGSSDSGTPNPYACFGNANSGEVYHDVTIISYTDKGCSDTLTVDDYIRVVPTPEAAFSYSPQILTIQETEVLFDNRSELAETYDWDFDDGSPINSEENPDHEFPNGFANNYLVTLWAYSVDELCKDSAQQLVIIKDIILFYIPNVFTPDGDQYNETFQPVFFSGHDPYDFNMKIFNRWGEVVFETYNASKGWDGTYSDRGLVEDGTYVWQIDFKETMSDKRHIHRGHVTILK